MRARLRNPNLVLLAVFFGVLVVVCTEIGLRNSYVDPADVAVRRRKAFVDNWKAPLAYQTPAPVFHLPDHKGKVRSLSEFRGKPVVLSFYSDDARSRTWAKEFQKIWKHVGRHRFHSISVVDFPRQRAPDYLRATGDQSVLLFETDSPGAVRRLYRSDSSPNAWLINPTGKLVYATPPIDSDAVPATDLKNLLVALRSEVPVERPGLPIPGEQ